MILKSFIDFQIIYAILCNFPKNKYNNKNIKIKKFANLKFFNNVMTLPSCHNDHIYDVQFKSYHIL